MQESPLSTTTTSVVTTHQARGTPAGSAKSPYSTYSILLDLVHHTLAVPVSSMCECIDPRTAVQCTRIAQVPCTRSPACTPPSALHGGRRTRRGPGRATARRDTDGPPRSIQRDGEVSDGYRQRHACRQTPCAAAVVRGYHRWEGLALGPAGRISARIVRELAVNQRWAQVVWRWRSGPGWAGLPGGGTP